MLDGLRLLPPEKLRSLEELGNLLIASPPVGGGESEPPFAVAAVEVVTSEKVRWRIGIGIGIGSGGLEPVGDALGGVERVGDV